MLILILLHVAVAAFLVYLFLRNGRAHREPKKALLEAAGWGLLGSVIAVVLETLTIGGIPVTNFAAHGSRAVLAAAVALLGVGVIEELAKLLPLTWFVFKRPYFSEHTDGIIYFSFAGLAFGLVENISYTLFYGADVGLMRLLLMPYFHAALTGIAGYYIASRKIRHIPMSRVVGAISVLIVLHGFYDFCLESGNVIMVLLALPVLVLLVAGLFLYMRHARILDQQMAIAPRHIDAFCPHCGRPNSHKTRFCEYCGQLASA